MIPAQLTLHRFVALLHRPAALPEPNRFEPTRLRRQIREGELDLAVGLLLDQQPVRVGEGTRALLPALRRPDPDPTEAARQLPLGPLPPRYLPAGQAPRQGRQTHRSRARLGQTRLRPRSSAG